MNDDVALDSHHEPAGFSDRFALALVRFMRFFADVFFSGRYGHRAVVLETVAASGAAMNAYFSDLTDPSSSPYVNRLYELGITNGRATGQFCPKAQGSFAETHTGIGRKAALPLADKGIIVGNAAVKILCLSESGNGDKADLKLKQNEG